MTCILSAKNRIHKIKQQLSKDSSNKIYADLLDYLPGVMPCAQIILDRVAPELGTSRSISSSLFKEQINKKKLEQIIEYLREIADLMDLKRVATLRNFVQIDALSPEQLALIDRVIELGIRARSARLRRLIATFTVCVGHEILDDPTDILIFNRIADILKQLDDLDIDVFYILTGIDDKHSSAGCKAILENKRISPHYVFLSMAKLYHLGLTLLRIDQISFNIFTKKDSLLNNCKEYAQNSCNEKTENTLYSDFIRSVLVYEPTLDIS